MIGYDTTLVTITQNVALRFFGMEKSFNGIAPWFFVSRYRTGTDRAKSGSYRTGTYFWLGRYRAVGKVPYR